MFVEVEIGVDVVVVIVVAVATVVVEAEEEDTVFSSLSDFLISQLNSFKSLLLSSS